MHPAKKEVQIYAIIMNDMLEKERFTPGMQLAILLLSFGVCWLIGGMVTLAIASSMLHQGLFAIAENPSLIENNPEVARTSQVVGTFFMFALPVLVFAFLLDNKKPLAVIGFNKAVNGKQFLFVLGIMLCALWVSEALGLLNTLIPLPAEREAYFKKLEETYTTDALALLDFKSTGGYVLSLVIIALLPAIFEELLFRGCMQKVIYGLSRHAFLSIFITSLAFSYIHMSYYGFLPRLFLGMVLGYMYYYSKNIWLNIAAHFLNNAFSITFMYVLVKNGKAMKDAVDQSNVTANMSIYNTFFAGAICLAAIYFLFKFFRRESDKVLAAHAPVITTVDNNITGSDTTNYI